MEKSNYLGAICQQYDWPRKTVKQDLLPLYMIQLKRIGYKDGPVRFLQNPRVVKFIKSLLDPEVPTPPTDQELGLIEETKPEDISYNFNKLNVTLTQ